jgi:phage recombination protein Bet
MSNYETGTDVAVRETTNTIRLAAQLPAKFWPDERIKAVAKTVAPPGTSVNELALFLSVANRYDLDPFVNEIWLVKDPKKDKLMVMTGRDAYLKIAMRESGFGGINSGVVYEKDTFRQIKAGDGKVEIVHEITSMMDRGRIVGAYCVVYHKGRFPVSVVRTWDHYSKLHGRPVWQSNPDDMLETRVIVAALRRQYNISGLYTEAEEVGIDEGDGALVDFKRQENAIKATQDRVKELQAQLVGLKSEEEEVEIQEAVVVEEDDDWFDPTPQDHGPATVDLDAYIVAEEDEPTAVVSAETGEMVDEEPKPRKRRKRTPKQEEELKKLEALQAMEEEEEPTQEEVSPPDAVSRPDAGTALKKSHARYMAAWAENCGAGKEFRQRWQAAVTGGKESTKHWTLQNYSDAIELLESGDWTEFVRKPTE